MGMTAFAEGSGLEKSNAKKDVLADLHRAVPGRRFCPPPDVGSCRDAAFGGPELVDYVSDRVVRMSDWQLAIGN
jgi:hypothetical protein